MNVWICIAYDPLPGIDHTTRLLRYGAFAEQLASQGHSVVMWTSTFDHWRKTQRYAQDQTMQVNKNLRVELLHAPAYRRNISWARIRHNRALAARFLAKAQLSMPPDVIFAGIPCLELTEAAVVFARERAVPINVDIQDIWPEVYVSVLPPPLRPLGRKILHKEFKRARKILQTANGVTAVSRQYLDWACTLRGMPGLYDRVFHLGYRLPAQALLESARLKSFDLLRRLKLPTGKIFATFLGQFAASYDIDTIVRSARILEASDSNVHFILAGSGDKFARTQRETQNLRTITLTGWLEYEDTITLLQQSHIGLAAYSKRATQSLPYKPFEYMAFGLPIISSLGGELKELIESQGLGGYYQAGNPESLARAVDQLASIPPKLLQARRNAQLLYAREFDSRQITQHLISHLETLTQKSILRA